MQNFKIACDVDDVLGAFYPTICRKFGKPEIQVDIWDAEVENAWVARQFPDLYEDLDFWRKIDRLSNPESITFDIDHLYYIYTYTFT